MLTTVSCEMLTDRYYCQVREKEETQKMLRPKTLTSETWRCADRIRGWKQCTPWTMPKKNKYNATTKESLFRQRSAASIHRQQYHLLPFWHQDLCHTREKLCMIITVVELSELFWQWLQVAKFFFKYWTRKSFYFFLVQRKAIAN